MIGLMIYISMPGAPPYAIKAPVWMINSGRLPYVACGLQTVPAYASSRVAQPRRAQASTNARRMSSRTPYIAADSVQCSATFFPFPRTVPAQLQALP